MNLPALRGGASFVQPQNNLLPLDGEDQGGGDAVLHPPLAPPIKGGEFERMPFIPTLMNG
ncbi:MAG: hypothetical protein AMK69_04955 [Nitrospira bacterium SG8_3]|nr:MAG: hypothetical protein AMK69_04955 [Nitrospira bacterium SG8_3]